MAEVASLMNSLVMLVDSYNIWMKVNLVELISIRPLDFFVFIL
jgi:hypothetical protein